MNSVRDMASSRAWHPTLPLVGRVEPPVRGGGNFSGHPPTPTLRVDPPHKGEGEGSLQ